MVYTVVPRCQGAEQESAGSAGEAAVTDDRARRRAEQAAEKERQRAERDRQEAAALAEKERARAEKEAQRLERERARLEEAARKEAERRAAERERAVAEAAREAEQAQREADRAALEAQVAARRAARRAERARLRAEALGVVPERPRDLPPPLAALWRTAEPPRRGPRPGLTLDQITDAAVAIADAEGLRAVSMARVAEALGVSTMALYRYVTSKDELLVLMYDAGLADLRPPGPEARLLGPAPDGAPAWRARLLEWFEAQLAAVRRHPWLMQAATSIPAPGPRQLALLESGLEALDGTALPPEQRLGVVGAASLLVLSEGTILAAAARRGAPSEDAPATGDEAVHPALVDYATLLRTLADPATHPRIVEALDAGAFDDAPDEVIPDDGVAFRVGLFLDGVEALVARAVDERRASDGGTSVPDRDD